jgi:hypothetical protein
MAEAGFGSGPSPGMGASSVAGDEVVFVNGLWWYAGEEPVIRTETAPEAPTYVPDRSAPIYGEYDPQAGF